jgi:peptidoglycan/LPS O-acetylase OafA/YrhL
MSTLAENILIPDRVNSISGSRSHDRVRLLFLDGIRGLTALYVVLFHAKLEAADDFVEMSYTGVLKSLSFLVRFGHPAVTIFIVLSGFCLMLPVARSRDGQLPGGVSKYLLRRARRILPAYYAAMALCLLGIAFVPALNHPVADQWLSALPAFSPGPILSHLFVAHNFNPNWMFRINPPMWSVPPECDIYLLFPLILLPLWRRFGLGIMVLVAMVFGVAPHFVLGQKTDYLCPWYFTAFAFGAAAATLNFSPAGRRMPWGWMTIGFAVLTILLFSFATRTAEVRYYASEVPVALTAASLMGFLADRAKCGKPSLGAWLLENRPVAWLGAISYSLYLTHYPVLAVMHAACRAAGLSAPAIFAAMLIVGTAATIPVAYVFHRLFERPWMLGHPKTEAKAAVSAVFEPAP